MVLGLTFCEDVDHLYFLSLSLSLFGLMLLELESRRWRHLTQRVGDCRRWDGIYGCKSISIDVKELWLRARVKTWTSLLMAASSAPYSSVCLSHTLSLSLFLSLSLCPSVFLYPTLISICNEMKKLKLNKDIDFAADTRCLLQSVRCDEPGWYDTMQYDTIRCRTNTKL